MYSFNNKPVHYLIGGLLLVLSVYSLFSAFNRGVANAWYFDAEYSLNDWAKSGDITNNDDYQTTLSAINKAQQLDPLHPHYAHMVGRIKHWGVDKGFEQPEQLTDVLHWYLLATELRPLWPDPWVDLLRLNNYLHGYNEETKRYMRKALLTGPYIDLVTVGTIQVWLQHWSILSGEERTLLFKQFGIATKQNKVLDQVLRFAKEIGKEKLLCSQLTFDKRYVEQKESYLYRRYCSYK